MMSSRMCLPLPIWKRGHLVIGVHDKTLDIVGTDTYNYDRQKAILRLTERCVNLSTKKV